MKTTIKPTKQITYTWGETKTILNYEFQQLLEQYFNSLPKELENRQGNEIIHIKNVNPHKDFTIHNLELDTYFHDEDLKHLTYYTADVEIADMTLPITIRVSYPYKHWSIRLQNEAE